MAKIISWLQSKLQKDFGVLVSLIIHSHFIDFSKLKKSAAKCFLVILMAASTVACSYFILPDAQIKLVPDAMPTDYRKIVSRGVPEKMTRDAQVSELRKTSGGAQPGDWMACVKSNTSPNTGFFAVFIEDGKVKDFRRSIGIDQCESAMYSPLPPAPHSTQETNPPRKRNKVDSTSRPPNSAN